MSKALLCASVVLLVAGSKLHAQAGSYADPKQYVTENDKKAKAQPAANSKAPVQSVDRGSQDESSSGPVKKKRWEVIVKTGEKWYQLSVQLVM